VTRSVVFSPRAGQQLTELYLWIAEESGYPNRADAFVSAIVEYCSSLADFPFVGAARDDIRPGVRTIGYRRRAVIAFAVTDRTVEILGIHYGGRDLERLLLEDAE
jgi:toxin ParE1/3/4